MTQLRDQLHTDGEDERVEEGTVNGDDDFENSKGEARLKKSTEGDLLALKRLLHEMFEDGSPVKESMLQLMCVA